MILPDDDVPGSKADPAASSSSPSATRSPAQLEDAVADDGPSPPPYTPRTTYNLQQQQVLLGANPGPSNYGALPSPSTDSEESALLDWRARRKLRKRIRRRFLRAFVFAIATLAIISLISPRTSLRSRPLRPPSLKSFPNETVIDCLEAKDWEDGENGSGFDGFAPNVKHALDHSLQIRSSWLDLPSSAKDIFIVTNGKNAGIAVVMDVSATDWNGLRVQLIKEDKLQAPPSNSTICLLTRGEGSYGFGILVDPEYDTKDYGFAVALNVPRQSTEYIIRKFEVDLEHSRILFGKLDGFVRFEELSVKNSYGDVIVGSVSADRLNIEMLNGPVAGMYTGAESLDITAKYASFMEVDVLLGGNGKNFSQMSLNSISSPINARVNFLPPDPSTNYGGVYNVSASSKWSSASLQVGNIPIGAEVNMNTTAESSSALLNLPAVYEGYYMAKSKNRLISEQPGSQDPYGLGRSRGRVEFGARDDTVSRGRIWWGDEPSEESVVGNIEVQGRELSFISFN